MGENWVLLRWFAPQWKFEQFMQWMLLTISNTVMLSMVTLFYCPAHDALWKDERWPPKHRCMLACFYLELGDLETYNAKTVAPSWNDDDFRLKYVKSGAFWEFIRASQDRTQDQKIGAASPYRSSFPGSLTPSSETTLHGSVKVSLDKSLSSDSHRGRFHSQRRQACGG